jgi:large subunit ribosomal protein L29
VKPSEIRDKSSDELAELEGELRDKLVRLRVAKAAQQSHNPSQARQLRKDIARIKTVARERELQSR